MVFPLFFILKNENLYIKKKSYKNLPIQLLGSFLRKEQNQDYQKTKFQKSNSDS